MLVLLSLLAAAAAPWEALEPGLELATFAGPRSPLGDGKIQVLRVEPARFSLRLMNGTAPGASPHTARQWTARANGVAAINPSMFAPSGRSVGLMRTPGYLSNSRLGKDKSVLVFGPRKQGLPAFRLLDRECDDLEAILPQYQSAVQSIRMLSCKGKNVWAEQPKRWSAAAIGQDARGWLLLIHVRTPYTMHALVEALRALPLQLARLMYVEGGPEAQLFLHSGAREEEWLGSFETGFHPSDDNAVAWPIPNALVVVRRASESK